MPHPLEQLRFVARSWAFGDELPTAEVGSVLAQLAEESPGMLLQACRRMIEYFPGAGPVWWLAARALSAPDPAEAVWGAVDELSADPTSRHLAEALPQAARVALSPLAPVFSAALRRRGDVRPEKKLGPARLLLVAPSAAGPDGVLLASRSARAATTAAGAGKPVWGVVARGVLLPGELWDHLLELALPGGGLEVVPAGVLERVVGEHGCSAPPAGLARPGCAAVAELRGWQL